MNDLETMADSALMCRVAVGEEGAIAPLVRRYERPLLSLLMRLTGRPEEAEDLFQETWLRVIRGARSYDPLRPFPAWLFSIAWNLVKNQMRDSRPASPLSDAGHLAGVDDDPSHGLLLAERNERIRSLVGALPPHFCETLFLRYFEELSEREVATRLGIPVGTVKSRLHNALKQLASVVRKDFAHE